MIEDRIEITTPRRQEAVGKPNRPEGSRFCFADVAEPLRGRADEPNREAQVLLSEGRWEGVVRS